MQTFATTLLVAAPTLAAATAQCPPGSAEKSAGFWALGWIIFGFFVLAGALLPLLIYRTTRTARRAAQWTLRLASIPTMLALWLVGSAIFLGRFVLSC